MTIEQLKALVIEELDSRNLKSRVRYSVLDKIIPFIKRLYGVEVFSLPKSKEELKVAYEKDKGSAISGAESSVINELYNQLSNAHSH